MASSNGKLRVEDSGTPNEHILLLTESAEFERVNCEEVLEDLSAKMCDGIDHLIFEGSRGIIDEALLGGSLYCKQGLKVGTIPLELELSLEIG